jgi:hypothetical protein
MKYPYLKAYFSFCIGSVTGLLLSNPSSAEIHEKPSIFYIIINFKHRFYFQCVTKSLNQEVVYLQGELVEMGKAFKF